jgi:hypothetical protein
MISKKEIEYIFSWMDKKYNITFFEKDVDAVIIYMDYLCNWRKTRDDKLANSSYSIIFDAILIPMQMNYIYGYYLLKIVFNWCCQHKGWEDDQKWDLYDLDTEKLVRV